MRTGTETRRPAAGGRGGSGYRVVGPRLAALIAAGCLLAAACCRADRGAPPATTDEMIKKVGLTQKLNAQVPLDLEFRDEGGRVVPLHRYFRGRPVMMNLIQYRCRMLCSEEMKVLADSLRRMRFNVGDQFEMLTLSIDAREGPALASVYKQKYIQEYGRPGAAAGWHFLTGDVASIQRLADAIGYRFVYDARTDQFAHPDGVIIVTPEGKVARYFFRLVYPPRDLRYALIEAARERIGSPLDALALLCYHYDPVTGKYSLALMALLRLAAIATMLALGTGIAVLSLRGRQARRPGGSATLETEG